MTTRAKAAVLRSYGYRVTYGVSAGRGKALAQKVSAVGRLWNAIRPRINASTGALKGWAYLPLTKARRLTTSARQRTPGGVFIKIPEGVEASRFRASFVRGRLNTEIRNADGVTRRDVVIPLDPIRLAIDPERYINELLAEGGFPRDSTCLMTVNGHDGTRDFSVKLAGGYITKLIRDVTLRGMDSDEIADTFMLKVVTGTMETRPMKTDVDLKKVRPAWTGGPSKNENPF